MDSLFFEVCGSKNYVLILNRPIPGMISIGFVIIKVLYREVCTMNKTKIEASLKGSMGFEMDLNGHNLIIDAAEEIGGDDLGPRPKQLLLAGLIGCTGIDVMSILKKMRVELDDLEIHVEADNTEEHPKVYENIHLTYIFKGKDLPHDNIEKAVTLSQERYCGVTAMLEKATPITYDIVIEENGG